MIISFGNYCIVTHGGVQQQKQSEYQATPGELLVGNNSSAWDVSFRLW